MTVQIPLSSGAEVRLKLRAAAAGEDLSSYAARLLEHFASAPTPLQDLSGPIYQRFLESGMSDDQLSELLEKAKHEMRAERRSRSKA